MNTLTFQPRKPPRYRPRPAAPRLTLVSAACDESPSLTLVFDRPVDVSAINVSLFRVDDGALGFTYVGYDAPIVVDDGALGFTYVGYDAPIVVSPTTVQILLTGVGEYAGAGVTLTAPANTGLVAADGGAAWPGVTGLALPFP